MREVLHVRQIKGEHRRRWFQDDQMDIYVWLEEDGSILGFQLCYNQHHCLGPKPYAVTWSKDQGYLHDKIDEGGLKTPILISDGPLPKQKVISEFLQRSAELPSEIVSFVHERLIAYSGP